MDVLTEKQIEELKDELFSRWQAHVESETAKGKVFVGPAADVRRERIYYFEPQAKDDPK